jgi:hypothetical protein
MLFCGEARELQVAARNNGVLDAARRFTGKLDKHIQWNPPPTRGADGLQDVKQLEPGISGVIMPSKAIVGLIGGLRQP